MIGWRRGDQHLDIHVYHHFDDPGVVSAIMAELSEIKRIVKRDLRMDEAQMADFTGLIAEVTAVRDGQQAAIVLINGIGAQIQAAIEAADAGDTAALAQAVSDLEASRAELAAAVVANTPAAPGGGS